MDSKRVKRRSHRFTPDTVNTDDIVLTSDEEEPALAPASTSTDATGDVSARKQSPEAEARHEPVKIRLPKPKPQPETVAATDSSDQQAVGA